MWSGSSLQLPQLIDVDRQPPPVQRDNETEADRHLTGGDDHDDQREDLAAHVAAVARERDEREIGRAEHQLQAEQDHERVAAGEHAGHADAEDHGRDDQVPGDAHRGCGPPASSIVSPGASPGVRSPRVNRSVTEISLGCASPARRRARMTAPTAAISSRIEASSNATRYVVRNRRPTSAGSPNGVWYGAPSPVSPARPVPISAIASSTNSAIAKNAETNFSPRPLPPASAGSRPPT